MWYIILSQSVPGQAENQQIHYEAHRQWLDDQHRAGRLLFSGPTKDRSYGIYVMLAENLDQAKRVAGEDPHHVRGIRSMTVLEWEPRRAFRLDGTTIEDVERMATAGDRK